MEKEDELEEYDDERILTICWSSSSPISGGAAYLLIRRGVNHTNLLAYIARVLALSVNDTQINIPWNEFRMTYMSHSPYVCENTARNPELQARDMMTDIRTYTHNWQVVTGSRWGNSSKSDCRLKRREH